MAAAEGQGASLVVGTAGHIDHGKSALVKALTGTDPDRLKEEQARGITIDLGFAHATIGDAVVSFVDVPGHERFVRNMLAGAGGFDAVLLVVAANESVMPQTREHFDICRLLGIERGLVALTKTDLVDADTRELAAWEVRELVQGSFLEGAPILPVSAKTGEGLDALRGALTALAHTIARRGRRDVLRLPVDRVFLVKGFGTVVTGTLVSGHVAVQDELAVLPDGGHVRVRGLQVHGAAASSAAAPCRVALNLGLPDAHDLRRGVTLAQDGVLGATRCADARIEILASARPLRHGTRVRVHQGTSEVLARVSIAAVWSGAAWTPARPDEPAMAVPPGGTAIARLRLEGPAVLTRGDRVVLRAYSPPRTIGGGVVLDPEPPRGSVRKRVGVVGSDLLFAFSESVEGGGAASAGSVQGAAAEHGPWEGAAPPSSTTRKKQKADLTPPLPPLFLADARLRGVDALTLVRRAGLGRAAADEALATLVGRGAAVRAGDRVVDARLIERASAAVEAALASYHAAYPDAAGMPRESLRDQTMADAAPPVFDEVLRRLAATGRVTNGERIALAAHRLVVTDEVAAAQAAIEATLKAAGLTPPDPASLALQTAVPASVLDKVVRQLVKDRRLVRAGDLVFHPDALDRLKLDIKTMKTAGGPPVAIDVAAFKDRYGLSRKFAIPLLEWLDRERVTRRVGEKRQVI